jgi:hypothetical protein
MNPTTTYSIRDGGARLQTTNAPTAERYSRQGAHVTATTVGTPTVAGGGEERCERHDVDLSALPTGYDRCPYCEAEEDREAQLRHLQTRDRRVEPW